MSAQNPTCGVAGCKKPSRQKNGGFCAMHYQRNRRHGHHGPAEPLRGQSDICNIEGCNSKRYGAYAMCKLHVGRKRRYGDALTEPPSRHKATCSYKSAHDRVYAAKGPAKNHLCVDCGAPAQEWSYDGLDDNELRQDLISHGYEYTLTYSLNPEHYEPRCTKDHRRHDQKVQALA